MIKLLIALIPLLFLIYKEYLSSDAEAKRRNEKFELDKATLLGLVKKAVDQIQASNAQGSAGAGNAWDAADKAANASHASPSQDPPSGA